MMSSINIKYYFLSCFLLFLGCNPGIPEEEYVELCPYERLYGGRDFYLEAPLAILPHEQSYQVGDTVTFRIELTDDIYDLSRQMSFKIKNFPFQPFFHLYRIDENGWTSGLDFNKILIDTIFQPRLIPGGNDLSRSLRGFSTYVNSRYLFEYKLILNTPGRYVNYVVDNFATVNIFDFRDGKHTEYLEIINESGCPDLFYTVNYVLQGDPHYDDFEEEMRFLDDSIYHDHMHSLNMINDHIWGGGLSRITVDWRGVFGFEVVE